MTPRPTTLEEIQEWVRTYPCVLPYAGGTKAALSTPCEGATGLNVAGLTGVIEYQPEEFTFTALAGTPVKEVEDLLAQHGQYLPFDPVLSQQGATLGGTVAAGLSGPGRQRYGGIRDFLIGVRFVDGEGRLVRGGGKVVKNAAGFDLPKLMVGSMGRLGILVELTFKVFPSPAAYVTLKLDYLHLEVALTDIYRLTTSSLELYGLDLEPSSETGGDKNHWTLWARLGGLSEAMPDRIDRLREFLLKPKGGATGVDVVEGVAEGALWQQVKEFNWVPAGWTLVKVPLTLKHISPWEAHLNRTKARRRYSAGGNVVWVAWPNSNVEMWPDPLNTLLARLELSGLVLFGPPGHVRLGVNPGASFARRVKQALDPGGRFLEL